MNMTLIEKEKHLLYNEMNKYFTNVTFTNEKDKSFHYSTIKESINLLYNDEKYKLYIKYIINFSDKNEFMWATNYIIRDIRYILKKKVDSGAVMAWILKTCQYLFNQIFDENCILKNLKIDTK